MVVLVPVLPHERGGSYTTSAAENRDALQVQAGRRPRPGLLACDEGTPAGLGAASGRARAIPRTSPATGRCNAVSGRDIDDAGVWRRHLLRDQGRATAAVASGGRPARLPPLSPTPRSRQEAPHGRGTRGRRVRPHRPTVRRGRLYHGVLCAFHRRRRLRGGRPHRPHPGLSCGSHCARSGQQTEARLRTAVGRRQGSAGEPQQPPG